MDDGKSAETASEDAAFLPDNHELGRLLRSWDWSLSPLTKPVHWPDCLKTVVGLMLRADAQIVLFWGEEFIALYNDAYAPTIGDKHPKALGRPAREYWTELWDDLEPLLRNVRETGKTFSAKDRPFYIERHGFGETAYFDVSYSAVPETDGTVAGVLCIVSETTERVLAERAIRESNDRLSAYIKASATSFYRMSPDWSQMHQLDGQGFLSDTLTTEREWLSAYIHPDDQPHVLKAIERAIGEKAIFDLEHRVRLVDGQLGWTHSRAVPIFREGEIVEWFGAASDVTEAKRAEHHKELLIDELNHRAKNLLTVIQSIAKQTFKVQGLTDAALKAFEGRLAALAAALDLLTRTNWSPVRLGDVVRSSLEPHNLRTDVFAVSGPDVFIEPKTAVNLALALHELATNAAKYGSLKVAGGQVEVSWHLEEKRLHVVWRERGGPPVEVPTSRGFGTRMIERNLAAEFQGSVKIEFNPTGLVCMVDASMPMNVS